VSFTDGLLGSAGQEEYTKGIGRLQRFVSPLLGQPAENIVDAIFSEWKEIVETMPRDDLTLFALRIVRGPLENPEGALLVYQ
ncbi:MAG: SpoIIE family protein phosphatase, partial [Armatimonadetes bacterium]|nr:SpoIIE family protein phosphatase [Armatimonadota bacterium]